MKDPQALAAALDEAQHSTKPLWDLAIAAFQLIQARRYPDALKVFDVIVTRRTLELSAYCNALWVVQRDNTGLPVDEARARRYLEACLPHAPVNPPIWLNAAGVLMELGEVDRAVEQLLHAARRSVPLSELHTAALFAPLRDHPQWAELESLARPPAIEAYVAYRLARERTPVQMADALVERMGDGDPRVRHAAARRIIWWRDEDGDDGHGGRAPDWLLAWYEQLGREIEARVTTGQLIELIARDLDGPFVYEAAYTLDILVRNFGWRGADQAFERVGPRLEVLLREGDDAVKHWLIDALWWESRDAAAQPAIRRYAVAPLTELVTAAADGPSLSDVATVTRDTVRLAVKVLEDVGALQPLEPALRRLVDNARGELADQYLRGDLVRLLARVFGERQ